MPDRIVLLSGGKIGFVEIKEPGGKLRPLHQARQNLRYSVDVGSEQERISALRTPANIYIINRENIQWLIEESGLTLGQLLPSISIWR